MWLPETVYGPLPLMVPLEVALPSPQSMVAVKEVAPLESVKVAKFVLPKAVASVPVRPVTPVPESGPLWLMIKVPVTLALLPSVSATYVVTV